MSEKSRWDPSTVPRPPPLTQQKRRPFQLHIVLILAVRFPRIRMRVSVSHLVRTLSILYLPLSLWYIFKVYAVNFRHHCA